MKVEVSAEAIADLERLRDFLFAENPSAAVRATAAIVDRLGSLSAFPFQGSALGISFRRLAIPFGRAAYLLDYQVSVEQQTVTILRIRHSREAR